MIRSIALLCFAALGCAGLAVPAAAWQRQVEPIEVEVTRSKPWPAETVAAFAKIPVQDRGRVKPLGTFAGFRMLNINGKRSFEIVKGTKLPTAVEDGEKIGPVEWMLDVCFFPEQARHYEVFLVNDSEVLEQLGLRFEGRKKRDRYSFMQLEPGREKLIQAHQANLQKRRAEVSLNRIESQTDALYQALMEYDLMESTFLAMQTSLGEDPSARLLELFPEGKGNASLSMGTVLSRWGTISDWLTGAEPEEQRGVISELAHLERMIQLAHRNKGLMLALIPPADAGAEEWRDVGTLIDEGVVKGDAVPESELRVLTALGGLWSARGDVDRVSAAVLEAQPVAQAAAEARGEFAKISLERSYYQGDYFTRALVMFLIAFVLAAVTWMVPGVRWINWGVWGFTIIGLCLTVAGVTMRCLLLNRPPVATLYETILFITAIAVLVCLVAEKWTKERIALASAAALGAGGMFLAGRYELIEAASQGDTMGGLVAVLNTNFWLATHVTTVTMGYSAGLLAAALGHVWVVMRLGRAIKGGGKPLSRADAGWYRRFARMIYGVLCFGLFFSVVGTILGGVWANDSWGRFWGWDPKENGALMIVLFELVILHARMGGYLRDFGVSLAAVVGGAVVAFSWWHVNQLGVGLHSYGFTEGILTNLWRYYGFVAAFTVLSLLGWSMFMVPGRKLKEA